MIHKLISTSIFWVKARRKPQSPNQAPFLRLSYHLKTPLVFPAWLPKAACIQQLFGSVREVGWRAHVPPSERHHQLTFGNELKSRTSLGIWFLARVPRNKVTNQLLTLCRENSRTPGDLFILMVSGIQKLRALGNQESKGELGKEGSGFADFSRKTSVLLCIIPLHPCERIFKWGAAEGSFGNGRGDQQARFKDPAEKKKTEGGGEEDVICLSQLYLKLILNVCLQRVRKFLQLPAVNNWDAFSSQLTYRGWWAFNAKNNCLSMDNPFQVSLNSRRKWRILTSTVHITNNPWTLFCFSACCPERLDKWFGTNLVFKPKSRWQGLLLAGRCSVGILVSPAHGNLEWNPQSIFLLVPILKEVVIVLKKGRRKAVSCEQSGVSEWGFGLGYIYISP